MNSAIEAHFAKQGASTVGALIEAVGACEPVYEAVANDEIFFDMERDLVFDKRAPIFRDRLAWEVDRAMRLRPPVQTDQAGVLQLVTGAKVIYDGHKAHVLSEDLVSVWLKLENGSVVNIARESIPGLVAAGRLRGAGDDGPSSPGAALVAEASVERATRAMAWHQAITPWLTGERIDGLPNRTLRKKLQEYRQAEATLGVGLAGLLDDVERRGNRNAKLMPAVEKEIKLVLDSDFGTEKAPNVASALRLLNSKLREMGLPILGRKALARRIARIPPEELAQKRYGHKVANAVRPPHPVSDVLPLGDRAFEVGHIDSTQVDLELVSERTGANLPDKAWLTVLLNVKPPMPLGWYVGLHKPNTASVLMAVRDCVRRRNRLPDLIVYDLGAEHSTVSFDLLKATYKVHFLKRPRGNPRFGAAMESFFNTVNQYFVHQLEGNTK